MTTATKTLVNGIDTDGLKALVREVNNDAAKGIAGFHVTTKWTGGTTSQSKIDSWFLGGKEIKRDFTLDVDEPHELMGSNTQANPQEYLLTAMNACIMATYVAGFALNDIELESLEIHSEGELDLRGFFGLDQTVKPGYDQVRYTVRVKSDATPEQVQKVHEAVLATSPNYWNMANAIDVQPTVICE